MSDSSFEKLLGDAIQRCKEELMTSVSSTDSDPRTHAKIAGRHAGLLDALKFFKADRHNNLDEDDV